MQFDPTDGSDISPRKLLEFAIVAINLRSTQLDIGDAKNSGKTPLAAPPRPTLRACMGVRSTRNLVGLETGQQARAAARGPPDQEAAAGEPLSTAKRHGSPGFSHRFSAGVNRFGVDTGHGSRGAATDLLGGGGSGRAVEASVQLSN